MRWLVQKTILLCYEMTETTLHTGRIAADKWREYERLLQDEQNSTDGQRQTG